jgi:hypothetical protein
MVIRPQNAFEVYKYVQIIIIFRKIIFDISKFKKNFNVKLNIISDLIGKYSSLIGFKL